MAAQGESDATGADEAPVRSFVNVDLDLESSDDLTSLVTALEPHAYALERAPGRASFELNDFDPTTSRRRAGIVIRPMQSHA
jgi:hypothetical protein